MIENINQNIINRGVGKIPMTAKTNKTQSDKIIAKVNIK